MVGQILAAACVLAGLCTAAGVEQPPSHVGGDWTRFGYDAARRNAGPRATGITAANLGSLRRERVALDGTVDSSAIYLRGISVEGASRDVFIVTTSYGKTIAVDAAAGTVLWRFTPSGYASWAGSSQITNATPVADPSRRHVYSASPDGRIHKLEIASGREVTAGAWPALITRDPRHEKIGPALNFTRGVVLAATGGYFGDAPPYQGHVAAIAAGSGRLLSVWNSLCSGQRGLIAPRSCSESGSAIWARAGVVVEPASGRFLVATGDGKFNGRTFWGDSVLMLSRDARRLVRNWTPTNYAKLESGDVDLGSTAPALLGGGLALQGGKDGVLRLLDLGRMNGRTAQAGPLTGGELQRVSAPGGSGVFTAPAVWRGGGRTWVFVANDAGTTAYVLRSRRLRIAWRIRTGGTSPVVSGGLLYVYDADAGFLAVYQPTSGRLLARLPAGDGHWNSPIVTDGRIALPDGNANDHRETGTLNIYRLAS
jgi:outer membrane protein assembly factor BamB